MAKKELITMNEESAPGFNLSSWVGIGGRNDKGDVMLIQAMFDFIVSGHGDISMVGLSSENELPDITGHFDSATLLSIIAYQNRWMRLLFASFSGKLFPVDYSTYQYDGSEPRRPAMTMLHQHAMDAAARLNEVDYTVAMLKEFPELRPFIKTPTRKP